MQNSRGPALAEQTMDCRYRIFRRAVHRLLRVVFADYCILYVMKTFQKLFS